VVLLGQKSPRMRRHRSLVPFRQLLLLLLLLKLELMCGGGNDEIELYLLADKEEGRKEGISGGKKMFVYLFVWGIIVLGIQY
jgi:hypothetical protein